MSLWKSISSSSPEVNTLVSLSELIKVLAGSEVAIDKRFGREWDGMGGEEYGAEAK